MMYCINVWNEIDIFMIQRQDHLIVADYESRYFEVDLLLSKTVSDVIHCMKGQFERQWNARNNILIQ